jgi:hypothetical protein
VSAAPRTAQQVRLELVENHKQRAILQAELQRFEAAEHVAELLEETAKRMREGSADVLSRRQESLGGRRGGGILVELEIAVKLPSFSDLLKVSIAAP